MVAVCIKLHTLKNVVALALSATLNASSMANSFFFVHKLIVVITIHKYTPIYIQFTAAI